MTSGWPVLSQLVGDAARFAAEDWGRRPCLRHAGGTAAGVASGWFSLDAAGTLLDSALRRPAARLVRADRRVSASEYTTTIRIAGNEVTDAVDPDAVTHAFAGGSSIVFQGLDRTWPPLVRVARRLADETGHPVQVNAYLSPPRAEGLPRHADTHDVFVVQLEGAKCWEVDGLGAVVLHPGDVLYLPVGTAHVARTAEEHSLHLTIGVLRDTYRRVLHRLLDHLDVPGLDDPLPLGYADDPAGLARALAPRLRAAADALGATEAAAVARSAADRAAARRTRTAVVTRLRDVARSTTVDDGTLVRLLPATVDVGVDDDGRLVVRAGGTTVRLPSPTRPAIDLLAQGSPVLVGALPGLTPEGRRVLARRLVRDGLLTVLDAGAAASGD